MPYTSIEEKVSYSLKNAFKYMYLKYIMALDSYSLEYFNRLNGHYFFYDHYQKIYTFSRYLENFENMDFGPLFSKGALPYYRVKTPFIS